jgi:DNA invertase Pin-like site-specific DNA recombinase
MGVIQTTGLTTAVGYVRVSTTEQADSGAGLEAQRRSIAQGCEARGWELVEVFEDLGVSGKSLNRPGLISALDMVEAGRANVLVVAKLDRLSRSLIDFVGVMDRSRKRGWHLAALDLGVDTSTPHGEMVAAVMASMAQLERRLIGVRTREALAVKRSQGVRLGRPPLVEESTVQQIAALRGDGLSYARIGRILDTDGVETAHGGRCWHANTVRQVHLANQDPPPPASG